MVDNRRLEPFLGWFSIGLGVAAIAIPRKFTRLVGATGDDSSLAFTRFVGVREIAAGIGILAASNPAPWIWARVAGDAMDLSLLLGMHLSGESTQRNKAMLSAAAVAGIAALDVYAGQRLRQGTSIEAREVITINRPREELYRFWHDFENLPRFMQHLESVKTNGDGRSHWKAKAPAGQTVEWDAEIVDDRPNEMIAWRSVKNADVPNAGSVRFIPAPGGRGTEVQVELQYNPPGGSVGKLVAKLFGEEPSQQVRDELRAFKQVIETGEVVHSDASIYGRPHAAQPPQEKIIHNGTKPMLPGR